LSVQMKEIPIARQFSEGQSVLVAGSSWHADEKMLAEILTLSAGKIKLIIAPHEISEKRVEECLSAFSGLRVIRFSQAQNVELNLFNVLVIDNIGMLSSLYRYGKYAYVGGGFGNGIHNTLEAAVNGVPVFFGPRYEKFNEAKELLGCGGAYAVSSAAEMNALLKNFLEDEKKREKCGNAAMRYVQSNAGATAKILSTLSL